MPDPPTDEAERGGALRRRAWLLVALTTAALASLGAMDALGAFTTETDTRTASPNTVADPLASCDNGQHVHFGGFKTDNGDDNNPNGDPGEPRVWPAAMAPKGSDTNKLSVAGAEQMPSMTGHITAIAYCKGGAKPVIKRNTDLVLPSANNDELRKVKVSCPNGKRVIGGGWSAIAGNPSEQGALALMGLQRISNSTWQVTVTNDTGGQFAVTAVALCGKQPSPKVADVAKTVNEGTSATATAKCPQGTSVVFGGFKGQFVYDYLESVAVFTWDFWRSSPREISVTATNPHVGSYPYNSGKVHAIAYCT